jgi:hypothetical protein
MPPVRCQLLPHRAVYLAMRAITIGLLAVVGVSPAVAGAQGPPRFPVGNSAANQYQEVVPTATGGQQSGSIGHASPASGLAIAPSTARALSGAGQAGAATAALARATAPAGVRGVPARRSRNPRPSGSGATRRQPATARPIPAGASPAAQFERALTGSGASEGLGALLPAILGATLLGALVVVLLRRRRRA